MLSLPLSPPVGARLLAKIALRNAGDFVGHEFHGNQYTDVPTARPDGAPVVAAPVKGSLAEKRKIVRGSRVTYHYRAPGDDLGRSGFGVAVGFVKNPTHIQKMGSVQDAVVRTKDAYLFVAEKNVRPSASGGGKKPRALGDYLGHPFHGNQWTSGDAVPKMESGELHVPTLLGKSAVKYHAYADVDEKELPPTEERVAISELHPTQVEANPAQISYYRRQPDPGYFIDVYERAGKKYIADGHHRVVAELLRGGTHVNANVTRIVKIKALGDVVGHPFHGNQWTDGSGSVDAIKKEVDFIRDWVKENSDLFDGVSIVGSWATQHPNRMPDRRGPGTSDIDIMIHPRGGHARGGGEEHERTHWGEAAKLEKLLQEKFDRRVHINLEPVFGSKKSIRVLGDVEGHPFHGNQYVPGTGVVERPSLIGPARLDVSRPIIGIVDRHGVVQLKNPNARFNVHDQLFGDRRPGYQRFRVEKNRVQWDEEPSQDDRFLVEDALAKHGVDDVRHVGLKGLGDYEGHPFHGNQYTTVASAALAEKHGTAKDLDTAAFMLPDGTLVRGSWMHHQKQAEAAGTTLDALEKEGVVRIAGSGRVAELPAVPTSAQAKILADHWNADHADETHYLDVSQRGVTRGSVTFKGPVRAEAIRAFAKRALAAPDDQPPIHEVRFLGDFPGHPFRGNQYRVEVKAGNAGRWYKLEPTRFENVKNDLVVKAHKNFTHVRVREMGSGKIVEQYHKGIRTLGDYEGHPFHGNQWTSGSGGPFHDEVYHGSPRHDLTEVSDVVESRQYDNATSQFGAFAAPTAYDAKHYAGDKGALYKAQLRLDKPYEMRWSEFSYFQDINKDADGRQLPADKWAARAEELKHEAKALRQSLEQKGHDGIIVVSARGVIKEIASFKAVPVMKHTLTTLGDYEGHPFHGNQWTDLVSSEKPTVADLVAGLEKDPAKERIVAELERVLPAFSNPKLSDDEKALVHEWKTGNSYLLARPEFIAAVEKGRVTEDITVYRAGRLSDTKVLEFTTRQSWAKSTAEASDRSVVAIQLRKGDKVLFVPFVTAHHVIEVGVLLPPSTMSAHKLRGLSALRPIHLAADRVAPKGIRTIGDYEGHPFHGNQWTEGVGQSALTAYTAGDFSGTDPAAKEFHSFVEVNDHLRHGGGTEGVEKSVAAIDKLMKPSANEQTLYRVMSPHRLEGLKAGDVIEDKGFVSTTRRFAALSAIAEDLEHGDDYGTLTIKAPKGSRQVDVNQHLDVKRNFYAHQHEVILNRGAKFRVTNTDGKNVWAELL